MLGERPRYRSDNYYQIDPADAAAGPSRLIPYPPKAAESVRATRRRSDARLVVVTEAGHYPHAEQPEQFFSAVEAFLADGAAREES